MAVYLDFYFLSLLFFRLEIFFLCVNTIKIKKINSINVILTSVLVFLLIDSNTILLANSTTKTVNVEKIDDKDEYLNIKETVNQEKINKRLKGIDSANNIPR